MKKHYKDVRWSLLAAIGLLLLVAALTGCEADTTAPTLQPRPTDENAPTAVADLAVADTSMETTGEGTPEVEFTDFACLDCHTDEEQLKALAVEEEKENLSEGPG